MDQTKLVNTYIEKLLNEITENTKKRLLLETELEMAKQTINELNEAIVKLTSVNNSVIEEKKNKRNKNSEDF